MVYGHVDGSEIAVDTVDPARELKRVARRRAGTATAASAAAPTTAARANPDGACGGKTELQ
jgi:hypothetical protein